MWARWSGLLCAGLLGVAVVAVPPEPERIYPEHPPPGHTGGFGEPTCHQCHFDNPLNAPGGVLVLEGVPEAYRPAKPYRVTVSLERPEMRRGGFQLSVRFAEGADEGRQAGTLRALDARAEVGGDSLQYAQHTRAGTAPDAPGSARWTLEWTPPEEAGGAVVFHVAANAANDDASEFGDHIYVEALHSRMQERRAE